MSIHGYHTEAPHKNRNDLKNIRRIFPFLWDFIGRVIWSLLFLILAKLAVIGVPLVLKEIVDHLDKNKIDVSTLDLITTLPLTLLLVYGALRIANIVFAELRDTVFSRVRYRAMRKLSTTLLTHLYTLSLQFHLERKTGAITRDLERGTRGVSSILNYMVFNILPTAAEFILVAFILFIQYGGAFALVTFSTVIVYITYTFVLSNWRMHFRHKMNALDSSANAIAIDGMINYETVKYFNNETYELKKYDNLLNQWEDVAVKSQASMSLLTVGQGLIIAVGVTLMMILASQGVVDGKLSLGDLVLVNALMLQLFIPLAFLGVIYRSMMHALSDIDLMFNLMDEKIQIIDQSNAIDIVLHKGDITFKDVDFSYHQDRQILKHINFTIPAGKKVAVVGASGAGKSTLSRLLFRFYDPQAGHISIDGQLINQATQTSLRKLIGIVPQDTVLFNDTIYNNIAYANPDKDKIIDENSVIDAAKMANIHEFIEQLPQAYDTIVGERGLKLSGGEKQRIAIARVFLKNPPILIFDEATSSLDSLSEQLILGAMSKVASHRTTLVIAHRLSTIADAHNIIVMDNGKIAEQGTHFQLLKSQGIYQQMWEIQKQEKQEKINVD
ncbi:MAG: ABC transporter ATP-binding protein/permease [Pseudomonadota bacterium]